MELLTMIFFLFFCYFTTNKQTFSMSENVQKITKKWIQSNGIMLFHHHHFCSFGIIIWWNDFFLKTQNKMKKILTFLLRNFQFYRMECNTEEEGGLLISKRIRIFLSFENIRNDFTCSHITLQNIFGNFFKKIK